MTQKPTLTKRGAQINPTNRFESIASIDDWSDLEYDEDARADSRQLKTQFITDSSKSIITKNNSPDVGFMFSVNPYRGCEHGCTYCYARPTHETLGMNAGSDFETKIMVKMNAPALLRQELMKPKWQPQVIAMSGVTDCYQPAERRFKLTRQCLEVLWDFRNPATIISKNILMLRDLDILSAMAEKNLIRVFITITSLNPKITKSMEPRTPLPEARLEAVRKLRDAGIPVGVMVAPLIPGLTDEELPLLLKAIADAGAYSAGYVPLRLPLNVKPIFLDWLHRDFPEKASRVEALIKNIRDGALNDANFGSRMHGTGAYADQLAMTFKVFSKRFKLDKSIGDLDLSLFRRPGKQQGELFGKGSLEYFS